MLRRVMPIQYNANISISNSIYYCKYTVICIHHLLDHMYIHTYIYIRTHIRICMVITLACRECRYRLELVDDNREVAQYMVECAIALTDAT